MIKIQTKEKTIKEVDLKTFLTEQNIKSIKIENHRFDIIEVNNKTIVVKERKPFKAIWD